MPLGTAPGYRDLTSGETTGGGDGGYSWTEGVVGENGRKLDFNVTWLNPCNAGSRGYGFQLRCLSE